MARKQSNPLSNPLHYATQQLFTGPPATYSTAQRKLLGYDYGRTQSQYTRDTYTQAHILLLLFTKTHAHVGIPIFFKIMFD